MSNGIRNPQYDWTSRYYERPASWTWDPAFWETRAGQWGPPGIFLPPTLAKVGENYPLNPEYLTRMMQVPIGYSPLPFSFHWSRPSRIYLQPDANSCVMLHEYGHAMEPPGFAPAYTQLMQTGEYPPATRVYERRMGADPFWRWAWPVKKLLDPGTLAREAYAEYPRLHFRPSQYATPTPEEMRQYYPWLRWDVADWYVPSGAIGGQTRY